MKNFKLKIQVMTNEFFANATADTQEDNFGGIKNRFDLFIMVNETEHKVGKLVEYFNGNFAAFHTFSDGSASVRYDLTKSDVKIERLKKEVKISDVEFYSKDRAPELLGNVIKSDSFAIFEFEGVTMFCEYDNYEVEKWARKNIYNVSPEEEIPSDPSDVTGFLYSIQQDWDALNTEVEA